MTARNSKSENFFFRILILTTGVIFLLTVILFPVKNRSDIKEQESKSAQRIYDDCSRIKIDPDFQPRLNCYVEKFTDLARGKDLDYFKAVFSKMKKDDHILVNCHTVAHAVSSVEVAKNPESWLKVATSFSPSECGGGFIHGALEGYYSATNKPFSPDKNLMDLTCSQFKNEGGKDLCYHVMGHLLLVNTSGNVDSALATCSLDDTYKYLCFRGVFMENVLRDNLTVHGVSILLSLDESGAQEARNTCNSYTGDVSRACWTEIVHFFLLLYKHNPDVVFAACNKAPDDSLRKACSIHGLGWLNTATKFDVGRAHDICTLNHFVVDFEQECASELVKDIFIYASSFDRASYLSTQFCQKFGVGIQDKCLSEVKTQQDNNKVSKTCEGKDQNYCYDTGSMD